MAHVWIYGRRQRTDSALGLVAVLARSDTVSALTSSPQQITATLDDGSIIVLADRRGGGGLPDDYQLGLIALLGPARRRAADTGDDVVITATDHSQAPAWTVQRAQDLW
ncbi:hypothetical protein VSR01_27630 [Actinacidiphila sp. DG2A-62]|uniref:hypothetical protein n=1 Tax=Actinacidiphila sp. DG2A-62 TaxID=3108821 RepID=UPI002DBE275B|nr:hypothetical protein [Actinacidiphila sp. DG2A-62]MEC3997073.1 hypothetical protein [Actinacidiphila sp. DG2A-62]